jgi:hypothetical protein
MNFYQCFHAILYYMFDLVLGVLSNLWRFFSVSQFLYYDVSLVPEAEFIQMYIDNI